LTIDDRKSGQLQLSAFKQRRAPLWELAEKLKLTAEGSSIVNDRKEAAN